MLAADNADDTYEKIGSPSSQYIFYIDAKTYRKAVTT